MPARQYRSAPTVQNDIGDDTGGNGTKDQAAVHLTPFVAARRRAQMALAVVHSATSLPFIAVHSFAAPPVVLLSAAILLAAILLVAIVLAAIVLAAIVLAPTLLLLTLRLLPLRRLMLRVLALRFWTPLVLLEVRARPGLGVQQTLCRRRTRKPKCCNGHGKTCKVLHFYSDPACARGLTRVGKVSGDFSRIRD